jgi:hypothetical protein
MKGLWSKTTEETDILVEDRLPEETDILVEDRLPEETGPPGVETSLLQ